MTATKPTVNMRVIILLLFSMCLSQTTFSITTTWLGTTNTSWGDASNWDNGVPGISDIVIISTASNYPSIIANQTIAGLTLNSGTSINLNSYKLTVTGTASIESATVNGSGLLYITGGTSHLIKSSTINTPFNLTMNGSSGTSYIDDNTFNNPVIIVKKGTGGNFYTGKSPSTTIGDTYNDDVTLADSSSSGSLYFCYDGVNNITGDVSYQNISTVTYLFDRSTTTITGDFTYDHNEVTTTLYTTYNTAADLTITGNFELTGINGHFYFGHDNNSSSISGALTLRRSSGNYHTYIKNVSNSTTGGDIIFEDVNALIVTDCSLVLDSMHLDDCNTITFNTNTVVATHGLLDLNTSSAAHYYCYSNHLTISNMYYSTSGTSGYLHTGTNGSTSTIYGDTHVGNVYAWGTGSGGIMYFASRGSNSISGNLDIIASGTQFQLDYYDSLTVGGNITALHTKGSFLGNHSTSYLSVTGNIDITRNATASTFTLSSSGNLDLTGDFDLTNSYTGTITIGTAADITIGGNFTFNNTANATMNFAVSGTTFNGSGNFTITNSGTGTVDIASGAGDFDLSGNFIMTGTQGGFLTINDNTGTFDVLGNMSVSDINNHFYFGNNTNTSSISGQLTLRRPSALNYHTYLRQISNSTTGGDIIFEDINALIVTDCSFEIDSLKLDNCGSISSFYTNTFTGNSGYLATNAGTGAWYYLNGNYYDLAHMEIAVKSTGSYIRTADIASGTDLSEVYTGDLTLTAASTSYIYLSASASANTEIKGDLTINYNNANRVYAGIGGTIKFTGTGDQSITQTGTEILQGQKWEIDKASGKLILNDQVKILIDMTFTNGVVETSSTNELYFSNTTSTATGASNSSYVNGPVIKRFASAGSFIYPVGDSSFYAPITASAVSASNTEFTAEYFNSDPKLTYGDSYEVGIDHISNAEYWTLDRTSGLGNAKVTLSWKDERHGVGGVTDMPTLQLTRYNGTDWVEHASSTSGSNADGTIITDAVVTSFSPFALATSTPLNPLPIELLFFNADLIKNRTVDLSWSTASELNNDYFSIEKSSDALNWYKLMDVSGAGNSSMAINYLENDNNPYTGVSYYRLKQTDYDGTYTYSKTKSVFLENSESDLIIYPNPTSNIITVICPKEKQDVLRIYDIYGKDITSKLEIIENGSTKTIDLSSLAAGVYWFKTKNQTKRVVKV